MGSKRIRLLSIIGALGLALGMFVPAQADTTGSVNVTGEIVAAPLSITIAQSGISFGKIDSAATVQQSEKSATGWVDMVNGGALWAADNPISISVSSPTSWSGKTCQISSANIPNGLGMAIGNKPTSEVQARTAFGVSIPSACPTGGGIEWGNGDSTPATVNIYLVTRVPATSTRGVFSTTLTFTASLI